MKKFESWGAVFCLVVLTLTAVGQIQNGQFAGTVTDPSGAAIPDAKVTIKNQATDLTMVATTNQQGRFVANQLPVGTYTVSVTVAHFKSETHANLSVNAGSITTTDFKLEVGA